MGRLRKTNTPSTSTTQQQEEKPNIYVFVDDDDNVEQINKESKDRLKYCIDPYVPQTEIVETCVIGINDPIEGDCTDGIGLGFGDDTYGFAIYE